MAVHGCTAAAHNLVLGSRGQRKWSLAAMAQVAVTIVIVGVEERYCQRGILHILPVDDRSVG